MVVQFLTLIFSLLAAAGIYLYLLDNWLISIEQKPWKIPLIIILPIILVIGFGWLGWFQADSIWPVLLLVIFGWLIFDGVKEARDRNKLRAYPPILIEQLPNSQTDSTISDFFNRVHLKITTTDLRLVFYQVVIPEWKGPQFRIAQASDFHINAAIPEDFFRRVVRAVNEQKPDLVLLPGDFVSHDGHEELLPELLGGFQGRCGVYGTLGNHDYWLGADITSQLVCQAGIELLRDGVRRIEINDGSSPGSVVLYGCEYPWNDKETPLQPDWLEAKPGDLTLVLSHSPDNFYALSKAGFSAVLSGHLHAGQFRLPIIGALAVPSRYGKRFDYGHYFLNGTHLFVTAGIGSMVPALRINCPPDIFIIDFVGSGGKIDRADSYRSFD